MSSWRRSFFATVGSLALIVATATVASAQVINPPDYKPTKNDGGWVYQAAVLLALLAGLTVVVLVVRYMARAPRFARNEEGLKVVRADRVRPGRELPRRSVDVSQAASVVVSPPAIPTAAPVPVGVGAPTTTAPAPAPSPAPAPPASEAPTAAPAPAAAPAAEAPAAPAAEAPAAPAERPEVTLDQETFDKTLEELLAKGTDRRVAEGQARRAAMIAARKKAGG
jgi:hypothetical protein